MICSRAYSRVTIKELTRQVLDWIDCLPLSFAIGPEPATCPRKQRTVELARAFLRPWTLKTGDA